MIEPAKGWATAPLDELNNPLAPICYGVLKPGERDSADVPMVRVTDIRGDRLDASALMSITRELDEEFARSRIEPADVLISVQGTVGRVAIVPDDLGAANISRTIARIRPVDSSLSPWIWAALRSPGVQQAMEDLTGGTTRDSLNIGTLRTVEIPVAPIAEQRRIVAKLDALAARTARARADLDRVPVLAQMERRAILGRLFKKGWPETLLGEIASDVRYGTAAKCTYEPRGTPVLRIPNVANGRVDATDLKFASFTPEEIKKLALRVGDILVIRSNGSVGLVGRTAVVGTEAAGMLFAGYLIRIRVKDTVDPEYLNLIMQSAPTRNAIELGAKSSSGVHNINSEELKRIIVPLPTLQDQHAAVRDVSVAFAEIDRLVAEAAAARRLIDRLDQAILAKAFRGELAPQDPADEPASVMLDRIRAERAAAPAKAGRGRRAKASA